MGRWKFSLLIFLVSLPVWAQSQKDPLTDAESEEIREYADRPPDRVKLYLKFIDQRTTAIHQIGHDAKASGQDDRVRTLIEEFTRLVDELQDNLDVYSTTHADIRKVLKEVIETSGKWPTVLQEPPADKVYDFPRKTALDAAESMNDEAKKMLAEQDKYFAELKAKAKAKEKEGTQPPN
jgi:1,2-phenylacetyl-CoA epoxidase PaaB subunit